MKVHAGTSGFSYDEWKGSFYPANLSADAMLRTYASRLSAVEINNTFYRNPRSAVMKAWAEEVPEDFRFAIKASRRITHTGKLARYEEPLHYLWRSITHLGPRLGPVLFQTPPTLRADAELLKNFLADLPAELRPAFEFRHRSWDGAEIDELLRERDAARVATDDGGELACTPTATWGYARLRKTDYGEEELADLVTSLRRPAEWSEVYVFLKHEGDGRAPALAERLRSELSGE